MSATREAIEEIKKLLISSDKADPEKLYQLAETHAQACAAVMAKAHFCHRFLRDNKKAEAMSLAKRAPDLREEFQLVDFDEMQQWQAICEKLELPVMHLVIPDLIKNVIEELYVENPVFERLLRVHRRLALSHGPLKERLAVLRRLAQEDPNPDAWKNDIGSYEKACLEEILKRASQANKAGDLHTLDETIEELESQQWQEVSVTGAVKAIKQHATPHRERFAFERFEFLARKLRQAHAAMDEAQARTLMTQWEELSRNTGVSPRQDMLAEIAPAETWLQELEQAHQDDAAFEQACAALDESLDDDTTTDQNTLDNLAAAILRFEQGIPELLAARYNSRVAELRQANKRRFALKLAATAGALILIAVASTLLLLQRSKQQDILRWEEQISATLTEGNLESTEKLLESIKAHPDVLSAPGIQSLQSQFHQKHEEEQQRQEAFAELIASFEQGNTASLTQAAIDRAEKLARTTSEREQVENHRQEYIRMMDERSRVAESAFREKLLQLEELFSAVKNTETEDWEKIKANSDQCLAYAKILVETKNVSPFLKKRVEGIQKATLEILADAENKRLQQRALKELASLYNRPNQLKQALNKFVKEYPANPLAADFNRALGMADYWQGALAWQNLATSWEGSVQVSDCKTARDRLRQIETYQETQKNCPQHDAITQYREYLQAATSALTDDNSLEDLIHLRELIDIPLIADAVMVRTKDGKMYYMLEHMIEDKRSRAQQQNVKYICDGSGVTRVQEFSPREIDRTSMFQPSPQRRYTELIRPLTQSFGGEGWETFYLELSELTLQQDEMDPIFSAILLKTLLSYADKSDPFNVGALSKARASLDDLDLDVAWMDPRDDVANMARPQAARMLKYIKPLISVSLKEIRTQIDVMPQEITPYKPVGILLDNSETIELSAGINTTDVYLLWDDADKAVSFRKAGSVEEGKLRINPLIIGRYPQGSPLFMQNDSQTIPRQTEVPNKPAKTGAQL